MNDAFPLTNQKLTIFAGKGGVGKSTLAASYGLHTATHNEKTLLVDYDGGHSLARVLALADHFEDVDSNHVFATDIPHLSLAVIDPPSYISIAEAKKEGMSTADYLQQFDRDFGLIPFCDMMTTFFGVPTDIPTVAKLLALTRVYHSVPSAQHNIVIDIEPTAGLERLLSIADQTAHSLENLQKMGTVTLLALGAKWPDIATYLKGEYIRNAHVYTERLVRVAHMIQGADYFLVTIPEPSPVAQLDDVARIIHSAGGNVKGYAVNNSRGAPHEASLIERVKERAQGKPVVTLHHDPALCDSALEQRRSALLRVGTFF